MKKTIVIMFAVAILVFTNPTFAEESNLLQAGTTPASPFYFVERLFEGIGTFFTFGNEAKAERYLALSEERLAEAFLLAERSDERAQVAIERYEDQVAKAKEHAERTAQDVDGNGGLDHLTTITDAITKHLSVLDEMLEKIPEQAKASIEAAKERSMQSQIDPLREIAQTSQTQRSIPENSIERALVDVPPTNEPRGNGDFDQHMRELTTMLSGAPDKTRQCVEEIFEKYGGLTAIKQSGKVPVSFSGEVQSCFTSMMTNQMSQVGPATQNCKSDSQPTFTSDITDVSKIVNIVIPPNIISGDLKTHSYIETDHARVPVYAPADMVLTSGAYYETGPYRLDFQVSCEVTVRFMHITEPVESIRSVFPSKPAAQNDSKDQPITGSPSFKAGEIIGYTTGTSGVNAAGNWDFGVYNSATKNKYANDPARNHSHIYTTAVCPFDYFAPELRTRYQAKFNVRTSSGAEADGSSFCLK